MTDKETDETCESQLTIERAVPAKYVLDPRLLTKELEKLFGEGKFAVEVSQFPRFSPPSGFQSNSAISHRCDIIATKSNHRKNSSW